jgi:hypothetical protein
VNPVKSDTRDEFSGAITGKRAIPTLNDAFNELQAINAGQAAIVGAIAANTAAVKEFRSPVDAGTAVLKTIAKLHQITNTVLPHPSRQTDTMICSLEATARSVTRLRPARSIAEGDGDCCPKPVEQRPCNYRPRWTSTSGSSAKKNTTSSPRAER